MAVGGAVYQPTTVTYEQGGSGGGPSGPGCGWRSLLRWPPAPRRPQTATLARAGLVVAATISLAAGIKFLVDGSADSKVTFLVLGSLLLLIGVALIGVLLRIWLRRRGLWNDGKQGIEAGGGVVGATLGAPNPSTDPLVAAQYAPVRDAPPADDERRQLMDNKECLSSAEESDRMLESDPRIVLRPSKNTDEA